jgi:hypothetical protein
MQVRTVDLESPACRDCRVKEVSLDCLADEEPLDAMERTVSTVCLD